MNLRPDLIRLTLGLAFLLGLLSARPVEAQRAQRSGIAQVLTLTVNTVDGVPVGGTSDPLTCRATPGTGKVYINSNTAPNLQRSFLTALVALRDLPGGLAVDHSKFDLHFEFSEKSITIAGGSASIAAGVTAFSAMTGRPLREGVAITGVAELAGTTDAIGGLEWKIPAAIRAGASMVLIPGANERQIMALPMETRLAIPIFGISRLEHAILTSLHPSDPAARSVVAYLNWRAATLTEFGKLLKQYLQDGGAADEKHWRVNYLKLSAMYTQYFQSRPQAGGKIFAEMDSSLRNYPWDIGLRTIFEYSKRIRMRIAALEEIAAGERLMQGGVFEKAYQAYNQAALLDPSRRDLKHKAQEAAEAHFDRALRPTIQAAEAAYDQGKYVEAAEGFRNLTEATKGYQTRFPLLERLAGARQSARQNPNDPTFSRQAARLALDAGRYQDAAEEFSALFRLQPTAANAELIFESLFEAASEGSRDAAAAVVPQARQLLEKQLENQKAEQAALLHLTLGKVMRKYGCYPEAIEQFNHSATLRSTPETMVELAAALLDGAPEMPGENRDRQLTEADQALQKAGEYVFKIEAAYEVREKVDAALKREATPPFLSVQAKPLLRAERPVSGTLQFSAYTRSGAGVAGLKVIVDGRVSSELDAGGTMKGTFNLGWDTREEADGRHVVEVVAGSKAGATTVKFTVTVRNEKPKPVVGDNRTRFYHLSTCTRAPELASRVEFPHAQAAETIRYRPCFRCIK